MLRDPRRSDVGLRLRFCLLGLSRFQHSQRGSGTAAVQALQSVKFRRRRALGRGGGAGIAQIGYQCRLIQHEAECLDTFRRLGGHRMSYHDADSALLLGI
jgi:hypothetical protein